MRLLENEQAAALAKEIDEKKEEKRRLRALNTSLDHEGPETAVDDGGLLINNVYAFDAEIKWKGYQFHSVALSNPVPGLYYLHRRQRLIVSVDGAGTTLRADPQCEVKKGPLHIPVLEAHRVVFDNQHYKTNYGVTSPLVIIGTDSICRIPQDHRNSTGDRSAPKY